jgi:hypothetical protein
MELVDRDDCNIVRNKEYTDKGLLAVFSCDGDLIFTLPSDFSDGDVWRALSIANKAYSQGYEWGCKYTKKQIRELLFEG